MYQISELAEILFGPQVGDQITLRLESGDELHETVIGRSDTGLTLSMSKNSEGSESETPELSIDDFRKRYTGATREAIVRVYRTKRPRGE